jgi:dethiobiotin synthetase
VIIQSIKKWMKVDSEEFVVPLKFQAPEAPSIAASLERREIRFDDVHRTLYILYNDIETCS